MNEIHAILNILRGELKVTQDQENRIMQNVQDWKDSRVAAVVVDIETKHGSDFELPSGIVQMQVTTGKNSPESMEYDCVYALHDNGNIYCTSCRDKSFGEWKMLPPLKVEVAREPS